MFRISRGIRPRVPYGDRGEGGGMNGNRARRTRDSFAQAPFSISLVEETGRVLVLDRDNAMVERRYQFFGQMSALEMV